MAVTSSDVGALTANWLPSSDDRTAPAELRYQIHAAAAADFVPSASSLLFEGKGVQSATIREGLSAGSAYFVKLAVLDGEGARTVSNALSVRVADLPGTKVEGAVTQTFASTEVQSVLSDTVVITNAARAPSVGSYISSADAANGAGFLRRVIAVTQGDTGQVVRTEPASINQVMSAVQVSGSFKMDALSSSTVSAAATGRAKVLSMSDSSRVDWPSDGLSYSTFAANKDRAGGSRSQPRYVSSDGFKADGDTSQTGKWGKASGESRVQVSQGKKGTSTLRVATISNERPWNSLTPVGVCSVSVDSISGGDSDQSRESLSVSLGSATVAEKAADNRTTVLDQAIVFDAKVGASSSKPYRATLIAYLDDAGDGCTGDDFGGIWREEIKFVVEVFVTEEAFPAAEESNVAFSSNANLTVNNRIVTTFSPTVSFDHVVEGATLKQVRIAVNASPYVEQTLTIDALAQADLDSIMPVIGDRTFRKLYMTPAGIPIIISGVFRMDVHITGQATGQLHATEKLKIGYDNISYGLEYRDGQYFPIKSATPVYELRVEGEGNAQADLKIKLLPSLEITAYESVTGKVVLAPYLNSKAGIEGHVKFDAVVDFDQESKLLTATDVDYRLTQTYLAAGLDVHAYADFHIWENRLLVYPNEEADPDDYTTFEPFEVLTETTLMDVPKLTLSLPEGAGSRLPQDTRYIKVRGIASNVSNPLWIAFPTVLPEAFIQWQRWTGARVVEQIGVPEATYSVLPDPGGEAGVYWVRFLQPAQYTIRVGGFSNWGSWARQYEEIAFDARDLNGNAIPDWWEQRYGLQGSGPEIAAGDPDADGRSNLQEWLAGTDPTVPNPLGQINVTSAAPSLGERIGIWFTNVWEGAKSIWVDFGNGATQLITSITGGSTTPVEQSYRNSGQATISAEYRGADGQALGRQTLLVDVGGLPTATILAAYSDTVTQPGAISNGGNTDDTTPTLSGTLSTTLASGQKVNVYNGAVLYDQVATVNGTTWSFTPPSPLAPGQHSFSVAVAAFDGTPGVGSAAYVLNVGAQLGSVSGVSPMAVIRAHQTEFTFLGSGLPTSGLSVTTPGSSRNLCTFIPQGASLTTFKASCQLYGLGAQALQVYQGSRLLGEVEVTVNSNVADVTWASGSGTDFGKATVRFGELVTYMVKGTKLLADPNMGFAVEQCGSSTSLEVGNPSDTQRTFACWFNNEAGAVAGQKTLVVKDAPGGLLLYSSQVPVEVSPIDGNNSVTVSWDYGSIGSPVQGRGTNPRTVAINGGIEIEGFLDNAKMDVDISADKIRLFNFRSYAGEPGSALFDAAAFNGLVLTVPSSANWRFASASVGGANTLSGLGISRMTLEPTKLAIHLGGLTYSANTVVEVAYTRTGAPPVSTTLKLPHSGITAAQCYQAGSNTLVACNSAGAIALSGAGKQDGMRADKDPMSYSSVGSYSKEECVKDNVTGLIWEGKTASGTRAGSITYTNFGDGSSGDTSAYVAAVNAQSLCGFNDWRLPTVDELQSIVDYSKPSPGPTINTFWFPNSSPSSYWTSSPGVGDLGSAWLVNFSQGNVGTSSTNAYPNEVRLVRKTQ